MSNGAINARVDYNDLTWYQLQYAMLNTSSPYVSNEDAKNYCNQYPKLIEKSQWINCGFEKVIDKNRKELNNEKKIFECVVGTVYVYFGAPYNICGANCN